MPSRTRLEDNPQVHFIYTSAKNKYSLEVLANSRKHIMVLDGRRGLSTRRSITGVQKIEGKWLQFIFFLENTIKS